MNIQVLLCTKDAERLAKFYSELLGMEMIDKSVNGSKSYLISDNEPSGIFITEQKEGNTHPSSNNISIFTPKSEEVKKRAISMGLTLEHADHVNSFFYLTDIDGNVITVHYQK